MASRYRARHRFSSKLLRMRGEGRLGRPSRSSTATASNGDTFGISFAIYGQLSTSLTSRRCRKTGMCYNFRSRRAPLRPVAAINLRLVDSSRVRFHSYISYTEIGYLLYRWTITEPFFFSVFRHSVIHARKCWYKRFIYGKLSYRPGPCRVVERFHRQENTSREVADGALEYHGTADDRFRGWNPRCRFQSKLF